MKKAAFVVVALLMACRGEDVPRDYQNTPPAVAHPVDDPAQAPAANTNTAVPETSSGAEGTSGPYEPTTQPGGTPESGPRSTPLPENAVTTRT